MSITKKLVVTLEDDVATPSERIFIYKGDVGVDIIIELENFNYKIDSLSKKNMINRIEAYFKNPQGIVRQYNDEVDVINGDRIKFSFSKNVINDMQIIGQYELQFHLFDKENNRITIPSYYFYVKEPLHNTSEEQEYDSRVDYATVDYSRVKDDIVLFEVSENGYIKTNWQSGDLITSAKLNKIETQLEINTNKINKLENNSDYATNSYVNEMLGGKKLVYLTQAEYDLLTEEEKNNENVVYNITDSSEEYVTIDDLDLYATKTYVDNKIDEAKLSGGNVDLSNYVTTEQLNTTVEQINNKITETDIFVTDMTVINGIGGIESGSNLNGMTTLEILNKLIFPYVSPSITISSTPNGGLYEKGNVQTITNVRVTVTKKSERIIKIEIFDGETSLGILEGTNIENGGTFNFEVNVSVNSINKQLSAVITDNSNKSYSSKTNSFNFVYPYYVGVCDVNSEITESLIKGLTKKIETKGSKTIKYTTDNQRMIFAYPTSYGVISKILDANSFDVTNTFSHSTLNIIGLDNTSQSYYVYINGASTVSNFNMKFNY